MVRVLILKSGAPHQSQAPSSEFKGGKSSDLKKAGAPHDSPRLHPRSSRVVRVLIKKKSGAPHDSPRLHPRRSGVVRVLIKKSGAHHQSQGPSSEIRGGKSSDLKKQGRPISPRLHPRSSRVVRVLIKKKQGRPMTVRGSTLGDQGW